VGRRFVRIGGACLIVGLLGYLVVPAALWYLARNPDDFFPCACGDRAVERFASPSGDLPGYMCIADPGAGRIVRHLAPLLLPREAGAFLCDFAIVFVGFLVLGAVGFLALLAGALIGLLRPSPR
jgi:hypothetical protein